MIKVPDSKPSSKWYAKHCFDLHRKRIESIKQAPMRAGEEPFRGKTLKGSSPSTRTLEMHRENQSLLMRLAEISDNKAVSGTQAKPTWAPSLPTSLNGTYRKLQLQRIASENKLMSGRIVFGKPFMNVKRLEQEFQQTRKYKELHKSAFVEKQPSKKRTGPNSDSNGSKPSLR